MNGTGDCESYCSHGGRCMREPAGHGGKHRSAISAGDPTACEWADAEAITRAEADILLIERGGLKGILIVAEQRLMERALKRTRPRDDQ